MNIPWAEQAKFREAISSLAVLNGRPGLSLLPVREMACHIYRCLEGVDRDVDLLCDITCPECQDNCCTRATIWYDLKDLIYLFFGPAPLPDHQIFRVNTSAGKQCCHLTSNGCDLPRSQRPFVCSWYFCPEQKTLFQCRSLFVEMERIKRLRSEMEDLFCALTV